MQLHWLKTAWRNLRHNGAFSLINLVGLTTGFAGAMLIFCLLNYHLSFDNFHKDAGRIYRIVSMSDYDKEDYSQGVPQPLGKAFRNDYAYGEQVVMRAGLEEPQISVGEGASRKLFHIAAAYVEPGYFRIFNYPFLEGNEAVLQEPNNAVITRREANRLFPGQSAIGKQFLLSNKYKFTIAGILEDIPVNSVNQQQIYLSYSNFRTADPWMASDSSWGAVSSEIQCFIKLRPGITGTAVEKIFPAFLTKNSPRAAKSTKLFMQPLNDIHFNRTYDGQIEKKQLWGLALIGLFLVITAGINFVNLATARLFHRSREAGVRKVLGSSGAQIRWQFMMETGMLVLGAMVLSVLAAYLLLPRFNQLFDTNIAGSVIFQAPFVLFTAILFSLVTLLVGYYPGTVLSRMKAVETIKGKMISSSAAGIPLRKILVVLQFSIVLFMLSCTLIISRQLRSSMDTEIGFNKAGIVMINIPEENKSAIDGLRNQLTALAGVNKLSFCFTSPMSDMNNTNEFKYDNRPRAEPFQLNVKAADTSYLSAFGLQLVAGRNLYGGDTINGCLVNETFVKRVMAKSPESVIGKTLKIYDIKTMIVGVVKDFHTNNFHQDIEPVCMYSDYQHYYNCAVNIDMQHARQLLPVMEKLWKDVYPDYTWSYEFLDDNIREMYHAEEVLLQLIQTFSLLAILVGCIGLFGMVSFMAVQRKKEIGVRKVLGASIGSILWLFLKEFIRLLLIALVVAIPVAWYVMHRWLQEFVFRLNLDAGSFLWPVVITFVMVIVTISLKSLKAALDNPVISLKNE